MYLGRIRHGEWVAVLHSKQSVRTALQQNISNKENVTVYPLADVPDWRDSHTTVTYDADGDETISPVPLNHTTAIIGYYDPTVTLVDSEGDKVFTNKKMSLLDRRTNEALFVTEIFIGDDIPIGNCTLRTEYVSTLITWSVSTKHVYPPGMGPFDPAPERVEGVPYVSEPRVQSGGDVWTEGRIISQTQLGTYATLHSLEVVPSSSVKGTYMSSYMYEQPQSRFLLGQYDSGTLDFRKNPRTSHGK